MLLKAANLYTCEVYFMLIKAFSKTLPHRNRCSTIKQKVHKGTLFYTFTYTIRKLLKRL